MSPHRLLHLQPLLDQEETKSKARECAADKMNWAQKGRGVQHMVTILAIFALAEAHPKQQENYQFGQNFRLPQKRNMVDAGQSWGKRSYVRRKRSMPIPDHLDKINQSDTNLGNLDNYLLQSNMAKRDSMSGASQHWGKRWGKDSMSGASQHWGKRFGGASQHWGKRSGGASQHWGKRSGGASQHWGKRFDSHHWGKRRTIPAYPWGQSWWKRAMKEPSPQKIIQIARPHVPIIQIPLFGRYMHNPWKMFGRFSYVLPKQRKKRGDTHSKDTFEEASAIEEKQFENEKNFKKGGNNDIIGNHDIPTQKRGATPPSLPLWLQTFSLPRWIVRKAVPQNIKICPEGCFF